MRLNRIKYVVVVVGGAVCTGMSGLSYINYTWLFSVVVHVQPNVDFGVSNWCRRVGCVGVVGDEVVEA